jgi:hypothetical protein
VQIVKLMGLLDPVQDHKMGTVHVDVNRLMATASDQLPATPVRRSGRRRRAALQRAPTNLGCPGRLLDVHRSLPGGTLRAHLSTPRRRQIAVVAVPEPGHSRRLRASRELTVADGDHARLPHLRTRDRSVSTPATAAPSRRRRQTTTHPEQTRGISATGSHIPTRITRPGQP